MKIKKKIDFTAILVVACIVLFSQPVLAQSINVTIIGGDTLDTNCPCSFTGNEANAMGFTYGGCLPVANDPNGNLSAFTFTAMNHSDVSSANLTPYDTAVLNMASKAMECNSSKLTATQQAALVSFVGSGKKLIIYDSECSNPVDYSWLPYSFTTNNTGPIGGHVGTLTIVEENTLSNSTPGNTHYINASYLGNHTDAVCDMNVMTTFDAYWCLDMSGTNWNQITGPVHAYAKYPQGTDTGLMIYNGLDVDYLTLSSGYPELFNVWLFELQQPFNPSNLPCGFTVVGITLEPFTDENTVGEEHTVTAKISNLLGEPQPDVIVSFNVTSGPNSGTSGTCSPNADCTTDANGLVNFTYTGSGGVGADEIVACFNNSVNQQICSQAVTKNWWFTIEKDFRYTYVNFTEQPANLSDLLPYNGSSSAYMVTYVTKKKDGSVSSTNPGQLYGVINITGIGVTNVSINDTFGTQFDVNPGKLGGGVEVIRVDSSGNATILTNTSNVTFDYVNNTVDNDDNGQVILVINLTSALGADEHLMIYVKFQTALKHLQPDMSNFVNTAEVIVNEVYPGETNATIEFT